MADEEPDDIMAASSGGAGEWFLVLKPFLSSRYESITRTEIIDLCSTIVKCEVEILRHKENNKKFYDNFVVLSANFISACTSKVPVTQIDTISAACRVLLKYLIHCLQLLTISSDSNENNASAQVEVYLNAVQVLCLGGSPLQKAQISCLVDIMKGENVPQHTNTTPPEKDVANKPETLKGRSELSMDIFEQLTLPLVDGHTTTSAHASQDSRLEVPSGSDPTSEIKQLLLRTNTENLQALRAADTLLDLCMNLPSLKRARAKVEDTLAGKPFSIPTSQAEASMLRNCVPLNISDIKLAFSAINLPVLEPLNSSKLDKLSFLSMAVLYCAVAQAAASAFLSTTASISPKCSAQQSQTGVNKDQEDLDAQAGCLVEEALNMYSYIGTVIKNSTRAGGHVYQNHLLAGAWVLVSGLQAHLTATTTAEKASATSHLRGSDRDDKVRSPCKARECGSAARSGLQKFQQSFGILSVAVATKAIALLTELFEDLHMEACSGAGAIGQIEPAPLAIMGQFTALQRAARVLGAAPLNNFLFYLAIVSYGKACSLKRLDPPDGDNFSQSDSTTYYEDIILVSDESSIDEDDDSEPILGQWFEETLAPPDPPEPKSSSTDNTDSKAAQAEASSIIPEKGEAHGYITLVTNIFVFLNKHFLSTKSAYVARYVKNGLTEQQMMILAAIIRDLDRETSRTEVGTISSYFGAPLGQLYCNFSSALSRFTHNLITNNNLNTLQACLLNHLGVSPWNTDLPHGWPLQVYPRTLSVLAQVLLLRPQNEYEASVISIWHRLVNTLIENVLSSPQTCIEASNEDLNVEHAQVLLYLFQSLNLMQKKSVLLLLAGGILRCSEVARGPLKETQLLHLSRLLLLFDYIMKHLYDAPSILLEQIQWNLFYSTGLNSTKDKQSVTRKYTAWQEIEDNYRKHSTTMQEFAMKPRFYVLTTQEINNQDAPKLDGLACNFIMGTPDKLRYPLLLDALIEILNITHVTLQPTVSKMSFLTLCSTQYCFTICWRLLQMLPPSISYMERLATGENLSTGPLMLHSLIWGPRAGHKNFNRWLKDSLVKQGLYSQHSDKVLKAVSDSVNNLKYDVNNAKDCIVALTPDLENDIFPSWHILLLDCLLAKVQVGLVENESDPDQNLESSVTYVQNLFPHVLRLAQVILHCTRWSFLHSFKEQREAVGNCTLQDLQTLEDVLAISCDDNFLISTLALETVSLLPSCVTTAFQPWCNPTVRELSAAQYSNDIIPSENYILEIVETHISTLSANTPFSINLSLRRFLQRLVRFICDYAPKIENTDTKNKAIEMLVGITLDMRTDYLHETVSKTLEKMIGDTETDEHQKRVYLQVLDHTYRLIIGYSSNLSNSDGVFTLNQEILHNCLKFYEKIIEKSSGRQALESFFSGGNKDLVEVLMSVSSPKMSPQYGTKVLQFFHKLFVAAEKSSTDPSLNYLCGSMNKLANVDIDKLQNWLQLVIIGPNYVASTTGKAANQQQPQKTLIQENSQLLQALTLFIVKQNSNVTEDVALTILKALIPLGHQLLSQFGGDGFTELMSLITMLSDGGSGKGHIYLFPAAMEWAEICIKNSDLMPPKGKDGKKEDSSLMFEAGCCILDYVSDVINGVVALTNHALGFRALSPPWEAEVPLEMDSEWQLDDNNDDDDSGAEDSDSDSLSNKLCTFTVTQKEFMNQHWYHCHTCRMLDGVGVCSICARVCHKGHDLSYAKYGNFFCDCGAKEDNSCQALAKRQNDSSAAHQSSSDSYSVDHNVPTSSLRRRASSPVLEKVKYRIGERKHANLAKHVQVSKDWIVNYMSSSNAVQILIDFLNSLHPSVEATCSQNSPVGCYVRALSALQQLHSADKKYQFTDQLMLGTVGSQEGAFENVRMSYSGEQGQTIRQLLSAHIIRRVAMCCMTSTHGRRQHLAVSHEKGKITVLQLSALLKQNDSSTRKLTLSKLGSAPIPFTVLSLSSNLCNEDYLAVCGLKDCHILTFTSSGSVADHLVLHPQLETGNFIIKAVWLPGSQTKLALVTADFVKIFDLAVDALSPQYYFLVPSGKIRDCTFMCDEGTYHILLMSSPGHIYTEILNEDSSATHGSFYVTNTLEVFHLDVTDVNGQVAGGGVSIYYSHTLGLLFYSYTQGKSFISPITPKNNCLTVVFPITLPPPSNSSNKSNGSKSTTQPICQWTEIPNHPGLICCAMQASNNPVILMLKPDSILIQEVKTVPLKTKIMDMVAIRHCSGNELRTTLMLLCEDGSLKMSIANMETTGFWMSPTIQPTVTTTSSVKQPKKSVKNKVLKTGVVGAGGKSASSMSFSVDFFEHCQVMNDVEIGGNDLLQIYNVAQLKHRLGAAGLYVACNRPLGFTIEINNNDSNMVMVGVRVLVGTQDVQKAPSYVDIFGRIISLNVTRSRWFDIPFSREETLQADKKLCIMFGPSQDPETLTMVDSIKVYGKTKDSFGWPEDNEESVGTNGSTTQQQVPVEETQSTTTQPLTKLEKLVVGLLETLDGAFSLSTLGEKYKKPTLKIAIQLLTLPTPPLIQVHSKALLSTLHSNRQLYHNFKDQALLQHVLGSLNAMTDSDVKEIDAESYYRLILIVRGIAVSRPQNLVKFADSQTCIQDVVLDDPLDSKMTASKPTKNQHLLLKLMDVLWILHSLNPENTNLALVVVPGLKHTEQVIHALVEIVHAFNSCDTYSNITMAVYLQLLLCKDPAIAFSAKQALGKVLKPKVKSRRVFIPSPPHCASPPSVKNTSSATERNNFSMDEGQFETEAVALLPQQQNADGHNVNALEALLGGVGRPLLDIGPDADDETMVELAIALSLQEHNIAEADQALHGLQEELVQVAQVQQQAAQVQEGGGGSAGGHLSDTTASAAGSDDEDSTAATDGSTLRTSPVEQAGSGAGSESGGSIVGEHNVSGRSSAYGDNLAERTDPTSSNATATTAADSSNFQQPNSDSDNMPMMPPEMDADVNDSENSSRLHILRLQLLERLTEYLPKLRNVDGVRVIPFLQVVLQLTSDLDPHSDRDRACFHSLLTAIIIELQLSQMDGKEVCTRTNEKEVQLMLMKLLSVFMARCKTTAGATVSSGAPPKAIIENSCFVSKTTATVLHKAKIINYCNSLLASLLIYWTSNQNRGVDGSSKSTVAGNLLKEHLTRSPPDMTPLFLKQFVKDQGPAVFNVYPEMLTEIALRLPYQVHKYSEINESISLAFDDSWHKFLCEYMMIAQDTSVRRLVRKLLLFICGNKDKYRYHRDIHALNKHLKQVFKCCITGDYKSVAEVQDTLSLSYDVLVDLIEHLKACVEIAINRTGNWQKFCVQQETVLAILIHMSCLLDDGVAPTILHLIQCAIAGKVNPNVRKSESTNRPTNPSRKEREKSDDSATDALFEEATCTTLVEQINTQVSKELFARFIKTFMLESNITSVRWQAHNLILSIYKNSKTREQQHALLQLLWHLWLLVPNYGRRASQFVDVLGYFSLKFFQDNFSLSQVTEYVDKAMSILNAQNQLLAHHPNANLYAHMSQFVELDGYYLESEPCLVCNNPEVPFTTIKLSLLKVYSKFTTTTQIVKLLSSHTISKITVRIGDIKRTKMVKTINIYYNNRNVQAVVELKNKPSLWHKAKKVAVQSGQTEVKIEFPLPIVACNLMFEYADFYENIQASSETLQCPRCSAAVPANPGVCANCGENVFQCHKCRAINYDEKDPFLCNACGFCKYAKFDFTLLAKPCCAVEPIENDGDRKKMVVNINSLLEKADRVYKQLIGNKPNLESLVLKITEHTATDLRPEENIAVPAITTNQQPPQQQTQQVPSATSQVKVNKTIQMLAQQYCNECKTSFEELSKTIQRVLVSRKELVTYDRKHRDKDVPKAAPTLLKGTSGEKTPNVQTTRCYGCSTAATEHCLTLLRALASNPVTREILCSKGLIQELVWNNLRKGSVQIQEEVKQLLCVLTRDNPQSTEELCNLLTDRITMSLNGHVNSGDLGSTVRHEITLLAAMVQQEDECWELKLRCMLKLFLKACEDSRSPLVMESVILPCLKILQGVMKVPDSTNKKTKDKINNTVFKELSGATVDIYRFLDKNPSHAFITWKSRLQQKIKGESTFPKVQQSGRQEVRAIYLTEKYARRWRLNTKKNSDVPRLELDDSAWLKSVLFNPSSRLARQVACSLVELMCNSPERKKNILILLTCFLEELGSAGESACEFLTLYQNLIQEVPWKQFLTLQGVLIVLADLITMEIEQLHYLEATTLSSDLAQGYALNQLTELLASFLDDVSIRRQYKSRLVGAVLNGYLSLRRLVVQRTRLIDDTQEKLLELLEEMTTGTEEETKSFMSVCIRAVEKYNMQDILTPVFIFERLCSIVYPEENDVDEFFLTLEKDPQQEDFLQGRMLGNPYSSSEPALGPLMRDVKNKICQDCELVALLEDDNGMELLVNNKIIGLDLPVKDVYKKIWVAEGGDQDAMRIVYRMRGLLGDATEEFIETLANKSQSAVDNEEVYKMANVLAESGGLEVMVKRLGAITKVWSAKPLLQVLLKLFRLSIKVSKCREVLIQPKLGAMEVFLRTLQKCLDGAPDPSQAAVTEQLLDIMETVLSKATSESLEKFKTFSQTFGGPEYVRNLLKYTNHPSVTGNQSVLDHLTKVLAALVYANDEKMQILIDHFKPVLDLNQYDYEHISDNQQKLEMFCVLANGIERNVIGNTLKDYIISLGIVKDFLEYLTMHAVCFKPTFLRPDSDELKEFISKPGLKYCLRFLTGLAHSHENTQLAVSAVETISIIHRLEQVSSDEHVGSLAENLLEALCTNPVVAKQIDEVREFTRSEKKRLAMAMREKELGQLGMRTNDKGQVTAKSAILQQIEELGEETGLVCCICREGYKYQPTKVLGIYTFTKRCNVEDFEAKPRRTSGYTTVSHFNIVHIDCHMSAVRLARSRDEWESAALQNANTKCNGLLPLWGPQVPESAFASCLARHNTYLQESTSHRDIGHMSTIHDLKLLLWRFAQEKTFHEDTGGGGPQSNLHMVPYIVHIALYVINTTRVSKKEESSLMSHLKNSSAEKWIESAYEAEGPLYWATMSILLHSPQQWNVHKVAHLNRLIIVAHTRHCCTSGPVKSVPDKVQKDYNVYKPYLILFALIEGIYSNFFKNVSGSEEQWSTNLADFIRHNDEVMMKASEKLLLLYREEVLPCTSFSEFCDVAGLLNVINSPETYISDLLKELP